jgi:ribosome modulation factor
MEGELTPTQDALFVSILTGLCKPLRTPYEQGVKAREEGKHFHQCPYERHTSNALSWRIGWNDEALRLDPIPL